MSRGRFIAIEGGEGAGKSTQVAALGDHLRGRGWEVFVTREPGGTAGADQIRALLTRGDIERWSPKAECLLHYAARADHVAKAVAPALGRGTWVVSDRFADSAIAYQGHGHELGASMVRALHGLVLGDFWPDLTVVLDLPVEIGLARAAARPDTEDRYERMGRAFHERVRAGFLEIAAAEPERCAVVDARADADTVAGTIRGLVQTRLGA